MLWSLTTYGQTKSFYQVKGTVFNGVQRKSIELLLLDSQRKTVSATNSDSSGQFGFTGLLSGQYRLINNYYKIDTAVTVSNRSMSNFTIMLDVCEVDSLQAELDIKQGKAKLLLAGGIAPIHYRGQEVFERKFSISYYDYGCIAPSNKCIMDYNKAMFAYLDKQYGKKWRKEVRKDVIGLKKE